MPSNISLYKETFMVFAANFVIPEFRERFVHEALKKTERLHRRICHGIEGLFPAHYKGGTAPFAPNDACLVIGWERTVIKTSWSEVEKMIGSGGFLIIDISGRKFYAETEGEPRIQIWGGEAIPRFTPP